MLVVVVVAASLALSQPFSAAPAAHAADGQVPAGGVLRIPVPEAFGGKTVVGQLAVDRTTRAGFVTAFGCEDGLPTGPDGLITRADLNFDGRVTPVWSNRLIVQADSNGDVCLYTSAAAALIVDVSGVTFDTGINSFANRRTDTRQRVPPSIAAGGELRITVPEARGAKTVVGQVAVDGVTAAGFVTAYGCATGLPATVGGGVARADLNFDGSITPVWSNRLIVQADTNGDVCFYSSKDAALIVDVNGVSDVGLASFENRRIDTRTTPTPTLSAGGVLRVQVPEAKDAATVIGQIAVDRVGVAGFVTAYGCADGLPTAGGLVTKADLNFDGRITAAWSNRLIAQADVNGELCLYTSKDVSLIVDINGVSDIGIQAIPNRRTDTRIPGAIDSVGPVVVDGVPVWPPYVALGPLTGVAALTGLPADATLTARPILAVKIDNYVTARPQWGLAQADAVIEMNAEGVSRFMALYQTNIPSEIGPVRSARTGDVDLIAAMNRPVFAYSGANAGVTTWLRSAASSGLLVDYTAQRSPCYSRSADKPGPHNLVLDATCATTRAATAGPARRLWDTDGNWADVQLRVPSTPDSTFTVPMDGVAVRWEWDAAAGVYRRFQDGQPHVTTAGEVISANNVVVMEATYIPSPVDARSPNPITVGDGRATIHRDGRQIPVTWSRPTPYDAFTFFLFLNGAETGTAVPLDTGVTYLEITRAPG